MSKENVSIEDLWAIFDDEEDENDSVIQNEQESNRSFDNTPVPERKIENHQTYQKDTNYESEKDDIFSSLNKKNYQNIETNNTETIDFKEDEPTLQENNLVFTKEDEDAFNQLFGRKEPKKQPKEEPKKQDEELVAKHAFEESLRTAQNLDYLSVMSGVPTSDNKEPSSTNQLDELLNLKNQNNISNNKGNKRESKTTANTLKNKREQQKKQQITDSISKHSIKIEDKHKGPRSQRSEVTESKKDYFIIEHSSKYVDKEDTGYDLYYEDVLPIDAKIVEKSSRNRNNLRTVLLWLFIIIIIALIAVFVLKSYISFIIGTPQ